MGKNDVTTHVDHAPPTLTSSSTTLKRHLIQDAKWLHVVTLYILFETQDPQNHTLHIHSRLGKTKEYPSPPYQNIVQNYSETSGIQATAAVYHRSDIITKEPLRLVNSMKCDKSNIIRKKLAFFSIFVCDTRTEGSSPLSIYALGIFLDLHVEKGCFKPKSFKKQVNICENSLSQL